MSNPWQLRVYDSERQIYEADLSGGAEIGRQLSEDERRPGDSTFQPWHFPLPGSSAGVCRVVIAPLRESSVSRKHVEVKPLENGQFQIVNRSAAQTISLSGRDLKPGESAESPAPAIIRFGNRTVRIQREEQVDALASLPLATMAPGDSSLISSLVQATIAKDAGAAMEPAQLVSWINAFLGLLHSASGSDDFYAKAARALVELVKLDSGRVLFRVGESWQEQTVQACARLIADSQWRPSSRVMSSVLREKKTFWEVPDAQAGASTRGIDAVVAAPILDRNGAVIGALYGERRRAGGQMQRPISQLEAMLVEVLASGVAAGLARVEHEQAALRARLQLEQSFGKRLASKLSSQPELLVGRDTEISVLFCDIRGFSRISEKLGPGQTIEWIADAMNVLSQCVEDHAGVVIDFIGDELMAIWGAPEDQPDHAVRACRAALAMFASLATLNQRWQPILQEPMKLGVGINTGVAQVGDVGSKLRVKYGAMGNTVNLASRVQGATKHLKTPLLITDATRSAISIDASAFATRQLCQVRVVNIVHPVTLYELAPPNQTLWEGLKLGYENALDAFQRGEFRQACRILGRLILEHPNDGPSLLLLSRAVACLVEEPDAFDSVMVLAGK